MTGTHTHALHSFQPLTRKADINPQVCLLLSSGSCLYTPAPVTEDEEEHAEDNAGDSDVNADYDACSGCFALLILYTVT